ncbi:MAG: fumarylacetoacetate hydrolase family protein [Chloroflexi bacterium]|nr:fumarylacetoacetate hydrolase family protein [Chloroflexota bacterium]
MIALLRFADPVLGERVGVRLDDTVYDVTERVPSVGAWLKSSAGRVEAAIDELRAVAQSSERRYPFEQVQNASGSGQYLLPPVDGQDVWAAGVTYERSRAARQEEAQDGGDIYARVYAAERPELFFKARGAWVVGHHGEVGIRHDSVWNVPEPELTLVINPALEVVGLTAGNDMSSRDIEGANPLYLPQAKVYTASCALGPQIVLGRVETWPDTMIRVQIARGGQVVIFDEVHTSRIHRRLDELVSYLGRCLSFPDGVLLMTGTGIVPSSDFTLQAGDVINVTIDGIGSLSNTVKVI